MVWIAGIPQAKTDLHRALGVLVVGSLAVGRFQGTHDLAVKQPGQGSGSPIQGVSVESSHGAADSRTGGVIVGSRNCFAKIVGLHNGVIGAAPFPVNLIEIVGEEHDTADNAAARSSLSNDIDATEEKVPVGPHGGCIALFEEADLGAILSAIGIVCHIFIIGQGPVAGLSATRSGGEVDAVAGGTETRSRRAGLW